jgi:type VI protein secretion system component VasK
MSVFIRLMIQCFQCFFPLIRANEDQSEGQEAARQEAARQEAVRQEAVRQEAARQEAAWQEAARQRKHTLNTERYLEGKPPLGSLICGTHNYMMRLGQRITFEEAWKDYPEITNNNQSPMGN